MSKCEEREKEEDSGKYSGYVGSEGEINTG